MTDAETYDSQRVSLDWSERPFCTEGNAHFSSFQIQYERWGTCSPDRPIVLLVHHLTASAHAARDPNSLAEEKRSQSKLWFDSIVKPGGPIDTDKFCVLCPNLPGSCYGSTGPASINPETQKIYGSTFPTLTTRDIAHILHKWLESLGVTSIHMAVGGSIGGMVALDLSVLYPNLIKNVVSICAPDRTSPWTIGINHIQREIIRSFDRDHAANTERFEDALYLGRQLSMMFYRTPDIFRSRFATEARKEESDDIVIAGTSNALLDVQRYLNHHGEVFRNRFSPWSVHTLTWAIDLFDLGRGFDDGVDGALRETNSRFHVLYVESDHFIPAYSVQSLIAGLRRQKKDVQAHPIVSEYGHDWFLGCTEELGEKLIEILKSDVR